MNQLFRLPRAKHAGWCVAVVLGVVALSFAKPMAFSRYFVSFCPL